MDVDIRGIFFQTSVDTDLAVADSAGFRARVAAPCPGSAQNTVTLCTGNCSGFRLSHPKNVGTCEGYLLYYDQSGTFIGGILLPAGQQYESTNPPPPNTVYVKFGCSPKCGGSAILEYDVTDIS
jgi:hypothetical protein